MYMTKVTNTPAPTNTNCRADDSSFGRSLDRAAECLWLTIIFVIPLYINLLCLGSFLFAKSLLFQFMVLVLLGVTAARWLLTVRNNGNGHRVAGVRQSPLQAAAIFFGVAWIISTVFSVMPYRSMWGSLHWQSGLSSLLCQVIFFMVIAQSVKTRAQVYRIIYTLLISSGLVCIIGIVQYISPALVPLGLMNGRVISTDGNPLSLSAFIAMAMPLTLAMTVTKWKGAVMENKDRVTFAGLITLFCLQFVCLVMAQYSVTILVFVIGIFIFFGLLGLYLKRNSTLALSILSMLVIALTAIILMGQLLLPAGGVLPDGQQDTKVSAAAQVGLPSLGIRVSIWKSALDVIIDPAAARVGRDNFSSLRRLIGYGPETFMVVSQGTFPAELKSRYTSTSLLLGQPENHYLYLLATVGIFGLLSFLCLLGIFFFLGFRLLSGTGERNTIILGAALIAAVIQYCAHIFFNPSILGPEMVFWLMLGLMVAVVRLEGAEQSPQTAISLEPSGKSGRHDGQVGRMRKAAALLLVILFTLTGAALYFPAYYANLKIKESISQHDTDLDKTLTMMADAIRVQPHETYYYGLMGYYAYTHAVMEPDPVEKARLLAISTAAYESTSRLEPYLAYWRYVLAENYLYWANQGAPDRLADALKSYEAADVVFPENSVILNKWATALMQKGDYEEAARKLTRSEAADYEWVPTTYLRALLGVYQGCYYTAGNCFVYPIRDNLDNMSSFMGFCKQLSLYGGIDKVIEGLKVYSGCHRYDWLGFTLLGIADVFGGNVKDGSAAFLNAAGQVPIDEASLLNEIVYVMAMENEEFQAPGRDIQARLAPMMEELP